MKHIVSLLFSSAKNNFETTITSKGETIRISQFGAGFDPSLMSSLIKQFDGHCDAFALTGFHPAIKLGRRVFLHAEPQRFMGLASETPVLSGEIFRNAYVPWAIRQKLGKSIFANQRVAFISGLAQQNIAHTASEFTDRLLFADPYLHFGTPIILKGLHELQSYARRTAPVLVRKSLKASKRELRFQNSILNPRMSEFYQTEVWVSTHTLLERINLSSLRGKVLILDTLPEALKLRLEGVGVREIIHFTPDFEVTRQEPRLNYACLEAILKTQLGTDEALTQDEVLQWISESDIEPLMRTASQRSIRPTRKFAFIVHPLSVKDLFRHPALQGLSHLPKPAENFLEKGISNVPPIRYGTISGIKSKSTGQTSEGMIYTLFDTPTQLLNAEPEKVYEKLIKVAEHAARHGADLIGLGAFTKIVGDAGVTVANRSPIPVTTGNSLSAAATLWAAREASEKLGFMPPFVRGNLIHGTAMVVGASGSIGSVSAKLLSKVADQLVITGPRGDKLLELKSQIEAMSPNVTVKISTDSNRYLSECDLIVISTSSLKGNVIDIEQVKPGAVICDVSRPLSFTPKEAMKRPDVLIVESGEVNLPGKINLNCDIGLEETVVYACLAETALLSLEGRIENFTLSREINYRKVNEIYDLAKKHGATLATIRGPMGIITDQEIELCREHAVKAMKKGRSASASNQAEEAESQPLKLKEEEHHE